MRTPKSKRVGMAGVMRRISGLAVVNSTPSGSVLLSTFTTKFWPRIWLDTTRPSMWKRPWASVSLTRPSTVARRTPGMPRSPSSCQPSPLRSSNTLPQMRVCSKSGSRPAPVTTAAEAVLLTATPNWNTVASLTYSPGSRPAPARSR